MTIALEYNLDLVKSTLAGTPCFYQFYEDTGIENPSLKLLILPDVLVGLALKSICPSGLVPSYKYIMEMLDSDTYRMSTVPLSFLIVRSVLERKLQMLFDKAVIKKTSIRGSSKQLSGGKISFSPPYVYSRTGLISSIMEELKTILPVSEQAKDIELPSQLLRYYDILPKKYRHLLYLVLYAGNHGYDGIVSYGQNIRSIVSTLPKFDYDPGVRVYLPEMLVDSFSLSLCEGCRCRIDC